MNHARSSPLLRIYPVPFARHFCDLIEEMKHNRKGQPQLPEVTPPAIETFQHLVVADGSLWRQVDLSSVYNYVRRSKRLVIPMEWKNFFPEKI